MLKILYITTDFPPVNSSASIRNLSLVNGLAEIGNSVEVFTLQWPLDSVSYDESIDKYVNPNVRILRCPFGNTLRKFYAKKNNTLLGFEKNLNLSIIKKIKTIAKQLLFFPDIYFEWIKLCGAYLPSFEEKNYDLIISSSDSKTSHFIATRVVTKIREKSSLSRWLQIWGDPWSSDITLNSVCQLRAKQHEKRLLFSADKVGFVSSPTMDNFKQQYPELSKNFFWIGRSYVMPIANNDVNRRKKTKEIVIAHFGSLSKNLRDISPLLEGIKRYNSLKKNKYHVKLDLWGHLDYQTRLSIDTSKIDITIHEHANFDVVINQYRVADVLLVVCNKNSHQIPGKLYDYFGTTKQILVLVDDINSAVSEFIRKQARCVLCVNEPDAIYNNLKCIAINSNHNNITMLTSYSSENIAMRLMKHLD